MSDTGGFPLVGGSPAYPGKNNIVRDSSGSNSFGWENLNVGNLSVVGGYRNRVTKNYCGLFGSLNAATAEGCFAFGVQNSITGVYSAAFGLQNTVVGTYAFASGLANNVSGPYSGAIGYKHAITGGYSFAVGFANSVTGAFALASGYYADAPRWGEIAHSGGRFSATGDSQHGWLVLSNQSTSVTPVILYLNGTGASQRAVLAAGARWKCTLEIIATTTGAIDKSASWEYKFQIDRPTTAATTIIRTTPLLTLSDGSNAGAPPAGWSVAITADTTNGCPQIQVTGDTDTINWTAALHYVQSIRV